MRHVFRVHAGLYLNRGVRQLGWQIQVAPSGAGSRSRRSLISSGRELHTFLPQRGRNPTTACIWRPPDERERLEITREPPGTMATTGVFGLLGQFAQMRSRSQQPEQWQAQFRGQDIREFANKLPTNGTLCHPIDCINVGKR